MNIGDYVASQLRTFVAWLWGLAVTAVLSVWTDIPAEVADWLNSDLTYAAIAGAVGYVWYSVWRKLEPRLPDWVTRITLGSAKAPTYDAALKAVQGPDGVYYVAGPAAAQPIGEFVPSNQAIRALTPYDPDASRNTAYRGGAV